MPGDGYGPFSCSQKLLLLIGASIVGDKTFSYIANTVYIKLLLYYFN